MQNDLAGAQTVGNKKRAPKPVAWLCLMWLALAPSIAAQTSARGSAKNDSDSLHQFNSSVRALVKRVTPSVVQVLVTGYGPVEGSRGATSLVLGRQESIGSGVIIDPDGYIVTNAHVIRGAHRVLVNIPAAAHDESSDPSLVSGRGRTVEARIVGSDSQLDLALLKVEAKGLPALPLSDYNRLRQGEVVLAFGSPEGLQDSVTMGVVSAAARQTDPDSPMVFVQSDAPINPGSSGGPLVNVDGELVGINTFILTEGGGNEGLGFAIPSAIVAFAYPQLRKYGHVHRGETGIAVQAITPRLAAGLKLTCDWGVIISDVAPGSSANSAGLQVQDIITSVDGLPVNNLPSLGTRLFMRGGGERIKLGILRGSEKLSFEVLVVEPPHDLDLLTALIDPVKSLVSKLGIVAVEIDPRIAPRLSGLRVASGVIVAARAADSNVDVSLATGDVIHAINGAPVENLEGLRSALDRLSPNGPVVLQVERQAKLMFIAFKLDGN
ncbi:MAG: trypsin-like peptidase domain-containing protein [Pyrinomonadaceae bacterium]|nr:trypsin-like peptidase domain-containing protein [Pyrinomonadaceae bacterium]